MPRVSGGSLFRSKCVSRVGLWLALVLHVSQSVTAQQAAPPPVAAPSPAPQQPASVPLAQALETRGDLSLQQATIEKALFTIGASWRVNIVVGKEVTGNVSCIYKQAPLREVLDAILLANGYSYRAVGESLVVQKVQDVGSANPLFESASIVITHSDLQEVLEGARLLLSKQGQIKALTSAKSIVVVDYVDRVASIREFVARMDAAAAQATGGMPSESYQRLQVSYFHTQYIPVDNAKEPITAVLSQIGRVATMPIENRLVVVDYASNIAMVRRVLEKIDRPVPQVRITALIYDISLQDVEQLGINWNSAGKGNSLDADGVAQQSITLNTPTLLPFAGGTGGTATIRSFTTNFDINTVGLFLQNANDARLLANPNVTVSDNETANMSSVQEIPFQQITASTQGSAEGVATTAFKEVGIKLNVTPNVAADGTIKLVVEQEFGRLVSQSDNGPPTVDTRIANTTVRVANRNTLVIGGLRQRSDTGEFNGIPYLKDVRFFGPLFRSRDTTVRESELLIFLMPEIVHYDEPGSPREALANETINCRLDRLPMAEGCGGPGFDGCSTETPTEFVYPVAPSGQTPPAIGVPAVLDSSPPLPQSDVAPLRKKFEDRYQAANTGDRARSMVQQPTASQTSASVKEESRALMQLLRAR